MIKKRESPRIFWGWWTVLVTSTWSGLGQGFSNFGISVLFKPIADELNLTRGVASMATGIARLEGGIEALLTGWLCDRYGPRWPIVIGTCISVVGLLLMYNINSLGTYILVWGIIIAFGSNLAFGMANAKFITSWFVRKRGLALGTRYVLTGIFGVILLPIVTWLVTTQGWRMTCVIWSGVLLVGVPLLWYFVKQKRPEYYGMLPDGAKIESSPETDGVDLVERGAQYATEAVEEIEFTYRQAIKTSSYWLLTTGYISGTTLQRSVTLHLIPFLTDMGINATTAGSLMAMMIFFQIPARFLGGIFCDRMRVNHLRYVLAAAFLFQVAGIAIILLNQSTVMLYLFLALFGIGTGGVILPRVMIESRYFGRKAFGSIDGTTNMLLSPVGFIAPVYAGWVYDTSGSYSTALTALAIITVVGALLIALAKPPKPPTEASGIEEFV
ncbi:MFS transporter [Chloroflexota bacterium]